MNIDNLPEGGMGIKIISRLADELSYTRTSEQKNCLAIIKKYKQPTFEQSTSYKNPIQKLYFQVNTDLRELDQVLQGLNQLDYLSISRTVLAQIQLILAEAFTNAVRHAHKDLPVETPIDIEVIVFHERLEIRVWDYGQPFDLEVKLYEIKGINTNIVSEGGCNLGYMSKLTEQVSYR